MSLRGIRETQCDKEIATKITQQLGDDVVHFINAEEVADKVLADLAKGVRPGEPMGEESPKQPLLPGNEKRDTENNQVAAAAMDFKKEHPMAEDEMRRYLTSKNSNSYDEGGVRFRKGKETEKYAKETRIVPQDVDKEVSSQIEKKFDDEVEKAFPNEHERKRAESVIEGFVDDFAHMTTSQIINEINWQKKNEEYERQRGGGTSGRYNYHRMRFKAAMLASEREMEYRRVRAYRIKCLFGIEGQGRQIPVEGISKAFEETKGRDSRGRQILFRASLDLAKRLGTKFFDILACGI